MKNLEEKGIKLNGDGSGELASGNIKWDADGNLTVTNVYIKGTYSVENEVPTINVKDL